MPWVLAISPPELRDPRKRKSDTEGKLSTHVVLGLGEALAGPYGAAALVLADSLRIRTNHRLRRRVAGAVVVACASSRSAASSPSSRAPCHRSDARVQQQETGATQTTGNGLMMDSCRTNEVGDGKRARTGVPLGTMAAATFTLACAPSDRFLSCWCRDRSARQLAARPGLASGLQLCRSAHWQDESGNGTDQHSLARVDVKPPLCTWPVLCARKHTHDVLSMVDCVLVASASSHILALMNQGSSAVRSGPTRCTSMMTDYT